MRRPLRHAGVKVTPWWYLEAAEQAAATTSGANVVPSSNSVRTELAYLGSQLAHHLRATVDLDLIVDPCADNLSVIEDALKLCERLSHR
jgi:hypothetical protein